MDMKPPVLCVGLDLADAERARAERIAAFGDQESLALYFPDCGFDYSSLLKDPRVEKCYGPRWLENGEQLRKLGEVKRLLNEQIEKQRREEQMRQAMPMMEKRDMMVALPWDEGKEPF